MRRNRLQYIVLGAMALSMIACGRGFEAVKPVMSIADRKDLTELEKQAKLEEAKEAVQNDLQEFDRLVENSESKENFERRIEGDALKSSEVIRGMSVTYPGKISVSTVLRFGDQVYTLTSQALMEATAKPTKGENVIETLVDGVYQSVNNLNAQVLFVCYEACASVVVQMQLSEFNVAVFATFRQSQEVATQFNLVKSSLGDLKSFEEALLEVVTTEEETEAEAETETETETETEAQVEAEDSGNVSDSAEAAIGAETEAVAETESATATETETVSNDSAAEATLSESGEWAKKYMANGGAEKIQAAQAQIQAAQAQNQANSLAEQAQNRYVKAKEKEIADRTGSTADDSSSNSTNSSANNSASQPQVGAAVVPNQYMVDPNDRYQQEVKELNQQFQGIIH